MNLLVPARTRRHRPGGAVVRWAAIALAAVALLLSACSDETKDQIGEAVEGVETGSGSDTAGGSAPPATDPPATDPPATDPPATDPPATDPPSTEAPPAAETPSG